MQQHQPFNQLPPLRQSLSDSSLRSNDPGPSTINNFSSRPESHVKQTSDQASPRAPLFPQHQRDYPSLTLPLPVPSAAGVDTSSSQLRPRGSEAGNQHPQQSPYHSSPREQSPQASRASSSRSQQSDMMFPNYAQQYAPQIPSNAQYGGAMPQQQAGRILPSAHPAGILPPVYSQNNFAPSLPGPSPYGDTSQQILTPASTSHLSNSNSNILGPDANYQGTKGNYKYELRVDQQPQRARMCGFGDKDRRPITPPPCVRLIVRRIDTGEEVDVDRLDGAYFVLQVDLWDQDGQRDVNIIRASSSAPSQSISTAVQMGYPPPANPMYMDGMGHGVNQYGQSYAMPQQYQQHNSHVMYTRNLIGSLTVNASLLKDTEGVPGFWFVLSDLSVRTEGWFRLRMHFIDIGTPSSSDSSESTLNRGRCPVLSSVFSDKFQVYSAKKFPGVIESTPLSKCFAHQGIKIPIRKDGKGDKNDDDDDDYKRG